MYVEKIFDSTADARMGDNWGVHRTLVCEDEKRKLATGTRLVLCLLLKKTATESSIHSVFRYGPSLLPSPPCIYRLATPPRLSPLLPFPCRHVHIFLLRTSSSNPLALVLLIRISQSTGRVRVASFTGRIETSRESFYCSNFVGCYLLRLASSSANSA